MEFILYFFFLMVNPAWAEQPAGGPPQPAVKGKPHNVRTAPGHGASRGATTIPVAADSDFLAAQEAFRAANASKLEGIAKRLKKTPLEVYVSYYQLRLDLENADPQAVKGFLSRPEDTPVVDRLRAEWLKLLGKKQQWDLFDAEYPRLIAEDAELACYAMQSRQRSQEQPVLREARELWFNGKDQPESCNVLFESAMAAGIISEKDILRRLRLALEANNVSLAQKVAERLEGKYAGLPAALKTASADAERYLEKLATGSLNDSQRIVALFALHRLAKQSPELAAARWAKMSPNFSLEERQYFYGWLGYEAARNLDGRALQWFREAADIPLNERQAAWRVRAALRAQDWAEVSGKHKRDEPAAAARPGMALLEGARAAGIGETGRGKKPVRAVKRRIPLLRAIGGRRIVGVAGVMSAIAKTRTSLTSKTIETMLEAARHSAHIGLVSHGVAATMRWRNGVGRCGISMTGNCLPLRRLRGATRCMTAPSAPRTGRSPCMISACVISRLIAIHCRRTFSEHGLEEAWVYGLMRQESRFAQSAKSDVGAAGLMQIMPATARWVAAKTGSEKLSQHTDSPA